MKFHPFANVFPLMSEGDLKELAADIEAHGQREPIYTYEGQILDGRNRFNACRMAKRQPWFEAWEGDGPGNDDGAPGPGGDPVAFVVSKNLRRRHLDESQRAIVAAKLAVLKQGRKPLRSGVDPAQVVTSKASPKVPIGTFDRPEASDVTISQAAELLNVGRRSVNRARDVLEHGDATLVEAVEAGHVSVADAAEVVDKPKPIQQAALDAVRSGKAKTLVKAAEKIEPSEHAHDTRAFGRRTRRELEEEAICIRRIELEHNYNRIRNLRWYVSKLDPADGPSVLREKFEEIIALINELDRFVTHHLEPRPEASP
ncbi:MAG TPA: hypothetical protein VND64_31895 [Pirellulales bacterium]|nr:hypothetical protein [Pirellulales bacterium]